jgi:hypothetical protein
MSGHANDSIRLFTSLTFVYAVIQYSLENRNAAGYVKLIDESCGEDPDYVIPGRHEEKGWDVMANPVS